MPIKIIYTSKPKANMGRRPILPPARQLQVIADYENGAGPTALSIKFNVSASTILRIVHGRKRGPAKQAPAAAA